MCMCLVLFIVSKILDSSELLSCLLEMGVEYCLVPGMYQRRTVVWEGRGATARPRRLSGARESQLFGYITTKMF